MMGGMGEALGGALGGGEQGGGALGGAMGEAMGEGRQAWAIQVIQEIQVLDQENLLAENSSKKYLQKKINY